MPTAAVFWVGLAVIVGSAISLVLNMLALNPPGRIPTRSMPAAEGLFILLCFFVGMVLMVIGLRVPGGH